MNNNIDFTLPPPTIDITEARRRFNAMDPVDRILVLGVCMSSRPFTEYKARQVVEHLELVKVA